MNKKYRYLVVIFLIIASFISYGRILSNDFVNFDDNVYITENDHVKSGINPASIKWAFSTTFADFWHPLTWLSLFFDYELYGLNAGGYHLTNLILHLMSALLVFWIFNRATGNLWSSAFVAAVFALHPLRVESVAWAAERKDVLSVFFGLASIYVYICYAQSIKYSQYFFSLVLYALSLMSKPMLVTLPFVLLLLDYWPLNRWQKSTSTEFISNPVRRLIWEKAPFIFLTFIFIIVTLRAQTLLGAAAFTESFPFVFRMANAIVSYIVYLGKVFWPVDLAVFYPYQYPLPFWQIITSCFILSGITLVIFYEIKKAPFLFVGWFWFLGTLVPVIGLVPVGSQAMADRYTYFPLIGIAVIFTWGILSFIKKEEIKKYILFPAGMTILMMLAFLTWKQCGYWKNNLELFGHTLRVTKSNAMAHNNFGLALLEKEKIYEAIDHFNSAIHINPRFLLPYYNRGNTYSMLGLHERALEDFNHAIALKPDYAEGYYSRGTLLMNLNQYQRALDDFNKAIVLRPDYIKAYNNRGIIHGQMNRYDLAIESFNEIIRRRPDYASAYGNRGFAYFKLNQYRKAIEDYSQAIVLNPTYIKAYYNRSNAYGKLGQHQNAAEDLNKAVSLRSDVEAVY